MNQLKSVIYWVFKKAIIPFRGMGLSMRYPFKPAYELIIKYIIPNKTKMVEINGYKMLVSIGAGRDSVGIGQRLIYDHEFDPSLTKVVKQIVRLGMNCVDVGANIGYYTLLLAELSDSKVVAFEPESKNFTDLTNNILLNGYKNIEIRREAVGDSNTFMTLYVSDLSSGRHSLIVDRTGHSEKVIVPVVKLDSVINHKVDFIKIDTEGNDLNVLKGAERIIKESPDLIIAMEFWLEGLENLKVTPIDAFNYIYSLGFKYIYLVDEWQQTCKKTDILGTLDYIKKHGSGCNLILSKGEL